MQLDLYNIIVTSSLQVMEITRISVQRQWNGTENVTIPYSLLTLLGDKRIDVQCQLVGFKDIGDLPLNKCSNKQKK